MNTDNEHTNQDNSSEEFRRIDARAVKKWRVSRLIAFVIMASAAISGYFLLWNRLTDSMSADDISAIRLAVGIPVGAILLIQFLNMIIYPEIEFRQWSYCLTQDRIEIKKGIIFHNTTIIPITRIQHVTVSEGPLARVYGLAKVEITTAGSTNEIDGLAVETARELCDRMKNAVNKKVLDKKLRDSSADISVSSPDLSDDISSQNRGDFS